MIEIWKDVQGYEGLYQVSSLGRVRSFKLGRARQIKPSVNPVTGYVRVGFRKDGKTRPHYVHRLVAQAFVPNPLGLETVNHKNEDKANNRAENLEWMTLEDNVRYSRNVPVRQFRLDGPLVAEYPSVREAGRQTGISQGNISLASRGKRKSAGGFVWRYKVGDCSQGLF